MLRSHIRHGGIMSARRLLLTASLLLVGVVPPSSAAPVIDWDPAYFYEPGARFDHSDQDSEMKIVGVISAFGPPLEFLNANDPVKEYTFYVYGLISEGTVSFGSPGSQFYITTYKNFGTIEIYEGPSHNSAFSPFPPNVANFTDGELLLKGTVSGFYTQTSDFSHFDTGNAEGHITWTGGSLLAYVAGDCPDLFTGGITWNPSLVITGYLFLHDGKIDHECPTPARSSTWGRMKKLYR